MNNEITIDLHCHSNISDGMYSTEDITKLLHENKVSYASLTDHNSILGLEEFNKFAAEYNIYTINGVELNLKITISLDIHLLIYAFDLKNKDIIDFFNSLKTKNNELLFMKIKDKNKKDDYLKNISYIFNLFHKAGGYIFLAHPLDYYKNFYELETLVQDLINLGLDGLECFVKSYPDEQIKDLVNTANKYDLLISGGSDYHSEKKESYIYEFPAINKKTETFEPGIKIPINIIKKFFDLIF